MCVYCIVLYWLVFWRYCILSVYEYDRYSVYITMDGWTYYCTVPVLYLGRYNVFCTYYDERCDATTDDGPGK